MQPVLDSSTGGMQRVKVYRLNTEGMWDDKGTGSVSVEYMEVCYFWRQRRHAIWRSSSSLCSCTLPQACLLSASGSDDAVDAQWTHCSAHTASHPPRSLHLHAVNVPCRLFLQQSDSVGLVVISEEDTRTLLIHRISREDIYQRQGGASMSDSRICCKR